MQTLDGHTQIQKLDKEINGLTLHTLVHNYTGIDHKHLRITNGYHEIQPTREAIECK